MFSEPLRIVGLVFAKFRATTETIYNRLTLNSLVAYTLLWNVALLYVATVAMISLHQWLTSDTPNRRSLHEAMGAINPTTDPALQLPFSLRLLSVLGMGHLTTAVLPIAKYTGAVKQPHAIRNGTMMSIVSPTGAQSTITRYITCLCVAGFVCALTGIFTSLLQIQITSGSGGGYVCLPWFLWTSIWAGLGQIGFPLYLAQNKSTVDAELLSIQMGSLVIRISWIYFLLTNIQGFIFGGMLYFAQKSYEASYVKNVIVILKSRLAVLVTQIANLKFSVNKQE